MQIRASEVLPTSFTTSKFTPALLLVIELMHWATPTSLPLG
jgi:hypothetical protein